MELLDRRLRARFSIIGLLLVLPLANQAFGWGHEGHQVVANIAERHLTDAARAKALAILGSDGSLVAVATWADDIRHMRSNTAPWHFIDIPLNQNTIDAAAVCNNGDCVTAAITHFVGVLKDPNSSAADKNEALKFVVHFVGDLHQPLHCEDNNDRGGNNKNVTFFTKKANLHSTWDTLVIERIDNNPDTFSDTLDQSIDPAKIPQWEQGTVEDWALESHKFAQDPAYKQVPAVKSKVKNKNPVLADAYVAAVQPVIDLQLQKAGIRLAHILNQALQ